MNISIKRNNQETEGIGLYAESSLHSRIKFELAEAHDRFEVKVSGKVIDLVRHSGELVEVQTGNFGRLKAKVDVLGLEHELRVVYPVPAILHIVRMDPLTGELLSRRKSPKKADWLSVFDELVYFPDLFLRGVRCLEIMLVEAEEIRLEDGKGSWRRKGQSIGDRRLVRVIGRREIVGNRGMLRFLRESLSGELPEAFTSADLALLGGLPRYRAGRVLYVLKKTGLVVEDGKKGRSILYRLATPLP